jgi:hypothetical protein
MTESSTPQTGWCGMPQPKQPRGLVWEDDPANFDGRFYWSAGVAKALDDVNEVDENGDPLDARRRTGRDTWPQVKRYCFGKGTGWRLTSPD